MTAAVATELGSEAGLDLDDYEADFNIDDLFADAGHDVSQEDEDPESDQADEPGAAVAATDLTQEAVAQPVPESGETAVIHEEAPVPDVLLSGPSADVEATISATSTGSFVNRTLNSIHQQIWDTEHDLSNICREEERLKALLKSVKASRIEMVEKLEALLDKRDNPKPESPAKSSGLSEQESYTQTVVGVVPQSPPQEPQAWGRDQIEVLSKFGMTEKKLEALRAAADGGRFDGTIKGLRDWIAKYDLWYRDVKGCGTSGADKISDALTKYVAANPMIEEPLTAEDEAKHIAAAEFLGHTSPVRQEEREAAVSPDSTAIIGGSSEYLVPAISVEQADGIIADVPLNFLATDPVTLKESPTDTEPTKPARKKRSKKPAEAAADSSDETEDDHEQSAAEPSAGAGAGDEEEAYLKGCEAGASGASCTENPYPDRSSPQAKEWQRGWEECSE
jgi:ribosome modulation factor